MNKMRELVAEFIGTFWLVLGGCGSAVFAAKWIADDGTDLGIGFLGVSLAFGLTVVTGAYALGHISGGHFNPAVTAGLVSAGKFPAGKLITYWAAQVVGAFAAAVVIYLIASGQEGWSVTSGAGTFATNGYGELSPTGYSLAAVLVAEIVLTAIFLIVILGVTDKAGTAAMAGLAIGLTLALIHLISIPISNTSVNPARSTSQALAVVMFGEGDGLSGPLEQLWAFWLAPLVGAVLGGVIYKNTLSSDLVDA